MTAGDSSDGRAHPRGSIFQLKEAAFSVLAELARGGGEELIYRKTELEAKSH